MLRPHRARDGQSFPEQMQPVSRGALLSHQWCAAGGHVGDVSAMLATRMLEPIRELPRTRGLLAAALHAKPLCKIPVEQFVLDSLSATGHSEFRDAFTLSDHSCGIIAMGFSYIMWTAMDPVSLHCCT